VEERGDGCSFARDLTIAMGGCSIAPAPIKAPPQMVVTPYHPITQGHFRGRYSMSGANDDRRNDVEFVTDKRITRH